MQTAKDKKTQYCQDVSFSQLHLQINPNQNPSKFFVDINKLFLKFVGGGKRPRVANTILKEKNKAGRLMLWDFKIYHQATVIKMV